MTNIWAKIFFYISVAMILAALALFGFSVVASYRVGTWYDKNRSLISEKGGEYLAKFKKLDTLMAAMMKKELPKDYFFWADKGEAPEGCVLDTAMLAQRARWAAKDAYFQSLVEMARFVDANMKDCNSCKIILNQKMQRDHTIWDQSRQCGWLPESDNPSRKPTTTVPGSTAVQTKP